MNPFEAHAQAVAQIQTVLGSGPLRTDGAVLRVQGRDVPCTHSPVVYDAELMPGGPSPRQMIEQCEFLAADVNGAALKKFTRCQLVVRKGTAPIRLQLWDGGLLPGGMMYRFRLVDENYRA